VRSRARRRLCGEEVPEVIEELRLRLEGLLEAEDRERAEIAFLALYRLMHVGPDSPGTRV
jgi:hypothetical protein